MRLFIAIPLSEALRDRVRTVQDSFRKKQIRGNYTPRENLHITLAFIGEYPDAGAVLDALEDVSFRPFFLKMNEVGSFKDLWWTGFEGSKALEILVKKVRRALDCAGIRIDNKQFKAHVTILRKPEYPKGFEREAMSFDEIIYGSEDDPASGKNPAVMEVKEFSLFMSTRGKQGMIYTELGSVTAEED